MQLSASRPCRLTPEEIPRYSLDRWLGGPRDGLDNAMKRKILPCPCRKPIPGPPSGTTIALLSYLSYKQTYAQKLLHQRTSYTSVGTYSTTGRGSYSSSINVYPLFWRINSGRYQCLTYTASNESVRKRCGLIEVLRRNLRGERK